MTDQLNNQTRTGDPGAVPRTRRRRDLGISLSSKGAQGLGQAYRSPGSWTLLRLQRRCDRDGGASGWLLLFCSLSSTSARRPYCCLARRPHRFLGFWAYTADADAEHHQATYSPTLTYMHRWSQDRRQSHSPRTQARARCPLTCPRCPDKRPSVHRHALCLLRSCAHRSPEERAHRALRAAHAAHSTS